jgi:osmoprotectant transport system substrate-binding protein
LIPAHIARTRGRRRPVVAALALTCATLLGACGGGDDPGAGGAASATPAATEAGATNAITADEANAKVTLTIGSKNFTEQKVLGQIFAQGLAAAGFTVRTELDLGDQDAALAALEQGEISAYPEYTGTALLSFFGREAADLPRDPQAAYEQAREGFAQEDPPLVAYPPTPFTSSNEVAVTKRTARRYHLKDISDLAPVASRLTLYGSPECRTRRDCLRGLERIYGLRFKRFVAVPIPRRHAVLRSGRADVSIVFTTDPQITRQGEVLLNDDRGMFPPYNSTLVVRKDVADQAGPDLDKTVAKLQEQLTDENMQELNARVDLDGKQPAEVAKEYLQETGLVGG